jgi:long-chain fatty acid transport protein
MRHQKLMLLIFALGALLPWKAYASFIETSMGAAVVNDATAAYFNPAALVLLKTPQIIPLGSVTQFNTRFVGQTRRTGTVFTENGSASSNTNYYSPSLYLGMPIGNKTTIGFAVVSNFANRNPEDNAILRYSQASNTIQDYDFVPSIGIKINDYLSLGGGINFSYTVFHLEPIIGFMGSTIADSQSNNRSSGSGIGGNIGFLLKPRLGTLIGFNYRTVTSYNESGESALNGPMHIVSHDYHFNFRTPARSILSISQMLTTNIGLLLRYSEHSGVLYKMYILIILLIQPV